MITVNFYGPDAYAYKPWYHRIFTGILTMFSSMVHVDIQHRSVIYAADMGKGRVAKFNAAEWTRPTYRLEIHVPDEVADRVLRQYVQRGYGYGWLDFLLYPFRKFIVFDGAGKICSEMVAEIIVALSHACGPGQCQHLMQIACELEGKEHKMSPEDLFNIMCLSVGGGEI